MIVWQILCVLGIVYLTVFHFGVSVVMLSSADIIKRQGNGTWNGEELSFLLLRVMVAWFWPFAIMNGDFWRITIKGKI